MSSTRDRTGEHPTVLILGAGGGGAFPGDPSAIVLLRLGAASLEGVSCKTLLLPPETDRALLKAIEAVDHTLPGAVVVLGVSEVGVGLSVERVAMNVEDLPTSRGEAARPSRAAADPIDAAGPAAYFSTLPVQEIVDRMRRGGVPVRIAGAGGPGPSNRIYYALLHYVALRGSETWFQRSPPAGLTSRVVSISLPPVLGGAAQAGSNGLSPGLELAIKGVRIACEAIGEFLKANQVDDQDAGSTSD